MNATMITRALPAVAFIGFGGWLWLASGRLPMADMGPRGTAFFPRIVAIALVACALWDLLGTAMRSAVVGSPAPGDTLRSRLGAVIVITLSFLYIPGMSWIGYFPATAVYAGAILWMLARSASPGAGIQRVVLETTGLLFTAWLLFDALLGAWLPAGRLFGG